MPIMRPLAIKIAMELEKLLENGKITASYQSNLSLKKAQWPSCMIMSDDQISPPNLVCKQNFSHLHSFCVGILFNRTALGIHLCKTSQLCILKTRLGGEIYLSDVNMHKGYCKPLQYF